MNLWECEGDGCKNTCIGVGGAVGLRAIGWYFRVGHSGRGPVILCPICNPRGLRFAIDSAKNIQSDIIDRF